jgi:hypothetical protein
MIQIYLMKDINKMIYEINERTFTLPELPKNTIHKASSRCKFAEL